jgi:hypothetical protein
MEHGEIFNVCFADFRILPVPAKQAKDSNPLPCTKIKKGCGIAATLHCFFAKHGKQTS